MLLHKAADLCTSQSPHSGELYAQDGRRQRSHLNLHSHETSIVLLCKVDTTFLKGGGRGAAEAEKHFLWPGSTDL